MFNDENAILGIDYGLAYIGLALSVNIEIASPLATIENKGKSVKELSKLILGNLKGQKITKIIIGVSEGKMADLTKDWGEKISDVLQLPVEFVDETLSTIEAGTEKDNHAKSAAIILQRYIDSRVIN